VNNQADDFLSKLPADFKPDWVKERITKLPGGNTNPLNICLRQEVDRFQTCLKLTRSTLQDLKLAIAGTIVLNANLIAALNSIFDAKVPPQWLKVSWLAPTLGLWFSGLLNRYEQWERWMSQGRPKSFWLTGFFNGQGFLTAVKQEVTRKHNGWALDDVVLMTDVVKLEVDTVKDAPSEGVYIHGLFLDGAAWSNKEMRLIDQPPKILFHALPIL
jgi:dynein heavy chain